MSTDATMPAHCTRFTATVRKNEYDEYVVRFYSDGRIMRESTFYYTDCADDAYATAWAECYAANHNGKQVQW